LSKYDPSKKYRLECRALLKYDVVIPGSEIERIKKEFVKKYGNRNEVSVYFMENEMSGSKR